MTVTAGLARYVPDAETVAWSGLVLTTEFLLVAAYVIGLDVSVRDWALYVVPFVWINVAAWAVLRVRPAPATAKKRAIAGLIAGGYFLILAYFGGLVGPNATPVRSFEVALTTLPPGWSPAVLYNGGAVSLALLPYKAIGYGALAYLVYATALDASNALLGGVLGLFSCVSCSFPLVASLVAGLAGSGTGIVAAASGSSVQFSIGIGTVSIGPFVLSTIVYVVTVGLLYWRPVIGGRWVRRLTPGREQ
jgi:hypothetical protein